MDRSITVAALQSRLSTPPANCSSVRRVRTPPTSKKDDDPYAFKLLNQEVHSLGISMDNKTGNAMTKWQRTRNWELLVDPNLFCLSEKR
jgi:hypothetical protein